MRRLRARVHGECAFLYVEPEGEGAALLLSVLTTYPIETFLGN